MWLPLVVVIVILSSLGSSQEIECVQEKLLLMSHPYVINMKKCPGLALNYTNKAEGNANIQSFIYIYIALWIGILAFIMIMNKLKPLLPTPIPNKLSKEE